ncbi:MAG: MFS transporter, partial [Tranquillimonas sp.]
LAFRMAQAVIVSGQVLGRAAVRDMVPQAEAASMIGYVTMGMSLAPMLAPALGGLLEDVYGWRASFVLLALLGLASLWLTWRDMGETALTRASSFRAQIREYPELLTARRFWGYCAAAAFASGAFFAYLGGAPFVGSVVFGMEPARLGFFFGFMTFVGFGNGLVLPNATSGMLSVRPHLAGTASGLGGAIMIGGGAALSALAGALLTPGSGATPLLWIMTLTSALAVVSILYTIHRDRRVAAA